MLHFTAPARLTLYPGCGPMTGLGHFAPACGVADMPNANEIVGCSFERSGPRSAPDPLTATPADVTDAASLRSVLADDALAGWMWRNRVAVLSGLSRTVEQSSDDRDAEAHTLLALALGLPDPEWC